MKKQRRSNSTSYRRPKKAKVLPESPLPSSGPSHTDSQQVQVYAPVPSDDVIATKGFSAMENVARTGGDAMMIDAKLAAAELLSKMEQGLWDLRDSSNWDLIYFVVWSIYKASALNKLVSREVFYENMTGKNVSDTQDLVKAMREEDWKDVVHPRQTSRCTTNWLSFMIPLIL
jgi:hypothetical protein